MTTTKQINLFLHNIVTYMRK